MFFKIDIESNQHRPMTKQKSAKNFSIIFFLGIASGLPLALILSTLKALLLEKGFDLKTIGFFSLVGLPYTLKIFFAPIIDSCPVPFLTKILGQRKSWIILNQLLLVIFISLLGAAGIAGNISSIAVFAILVAFASASQDIVIDGYRIELIEKENQGLAASFYVYGYRIGMLVSGAGALVIAELVSWDAVYFVMSGRNAKADDRKIKLACNQCPICWMPLTVQGTEENDRKWREVQIVFKGKPAFSVFNGSTTFARPVIVFGINTGLSGGIKSNAELCHFVHFSSLGDNKVTNVWKLGLGADASSSEIKCDGGDRINTIANFTDILFSVGQDPLNQGKPGGIFAKAFHCSDSRTAVFFALLQVSGNMTLSLS